MLPFFYFCCMDFMQTDLGTLIRNAKILKEASAWVKSFDRDLKLKIEEMNRLQLQQGYDSEGVILRNQKTKKDFYSYITAEIYSEIGRFIRSGEHYTMKYTGDFYNSINVSEVSSYFFEIDANGDKGEENLFEKFGDDIIGLNIENKEKLAEILTEKYIKYVSEILSIG